MTYTLELTDSEMDSICFIGHRYSWSDALSKYCNTGVNKLPKHIAWEIKEAFEADTEGGHRLFPMLDPYSELCEKLLRFMDSIV